MTDFPFLALFIIKNRWMITGSAMVLYGIREQTHDIDLGCTKQLADRLEAEGCPVERLAD